ncbi:MAG TPA: hypothetical protein VMB02_09860 [Candidatus Aquilonibacter sp.]|nr:hypothetical protein [Candidatus Aquilonibacter sp.]
MRRLGVAAAALLAAWVAGCGGNSTQVGIIVSPDPASVDLNDSVQFAASVTGISTTTVYWQVCLPATVASGTNPPPQQTEPTDCTTIPGVAAPKGGTVLTGYGTINQNGFYTAPSELPTPNEAVILVTSTVKTTAFVVVPLTIESGVRVQVNPPTATLGPLESFQFTAKVTAPQNVTDLGVTWTLSVPGNNNPPPLGTITPAGYYTAPGAPGTVTVTATSVADPTQSGTATVTITSGGAPTLQSNNTGINPLPLDPSVAVQGSVQQDIYISGSNFESTSEVIVTAPSQLPATLPAAAVFFITPSLMRATVPGSLLATAGPVKFQVENPTIPTPNLSNTATLTVFAVRPALIAASPQNVSQNSASASIGLTGGYFSGATSTTVNGATVATVLNSSRQLSAGVPAGVLSTPGLYPITVQNSGVATGEPSMTALNVAVTPVQATIPGAPNGGAIGVGANPSAVAIDEADGYAVVANSGDNSVSVINVASGMGVGGAIGVGTNPTGVAVDDMLPNPVALVANKSDQTVTAIDLATRNQTTLNVSISSGTNPPLPFSVGVNPLTHRAVVAYQLSNLAMILDVTDSGGTPGLSEVQTIGGSESNFTGTGASPEVAVDPRLNWAIITPGGAGEVNVVDLGVDASPAQPQGRTPYAVANLLISQTVQGVAIDSETHQAFLTDPNVGTLYTYSLLDNTVAAVTLPSNGPPGSGAPLDELGFGAAAASPLEDVGIAVNANATAVVVDLSSGIVLQTVSNLGASARAQGVAVDPVSNQAVVINHEANSVSLVALGTSLNALQITEASPAVIFGGPAASNATLTILGGGFVTAGGTKSEVLLDGTALPGGDVNVVSARKIIAMVPAEMLESARRYIVQVQNGAGGAVSNVTDLSVVQPIATGRLPVGVAVDTDRDLAVATNSGDGTVSLISLATLSAESPLSLGNAGVVIGGPVLVGTTPEGVAILPRLGLAVVANNGSNNASVVDVTGVAGPVTVSICGTGACASPTGVAVNSDTNLALVTDTNPSSATSTGTLSAFALPASPTTTPESVSVDHDPVAVAVDPNLNYAAVTTASTSSSIDFVELGAGGIAGSIRSTALQNPSGIVFDPVNQVFLASNSLLNNVLIADPASFTFSPVNVGIAPTSVDYNYQTSTLVTANSPSGTLSILDYVCPPGPGAPGCVGPQVRTVLGLGGTQTSPLLLGANAVAIDPKLNLAVLADPDNNRVLLVPLPH